MEQTVLRSGDRVRHINERFAHEIGTVTAIWYPKHTETKNVRRNGRWRTVIKWNKGEQVVKVQWDALTEEQARINDRFRIERLRGWIRSAHLTVVSETAEVTA